jgi:hypothetical protein
MLSAHETADGHYRCSIFQNLMGTPYIFAVGRCNNLPLVRGYGSSDYETRALFRSITSIIHSQASEKFLDNSDEIRLRRYPSPRLLVKLGTANATGSTAWGGAMYGPLALKEYKKEMDYLVKEFLFPVFYKQQWLDLVFARITNWKASEITDVVDFNHSENLC